MQLEKMITEGSNAASAEIDRVSTLEMCRIINDEDKTVPLAVERVLPDITAAIDVIHAQVSGGGRLIYLGAGTSGRLGILDASECPPTYGVKPGLVVGLIAGGEYAIQHAVEGAEDSREGGVNDLKNINLTAQDVVVGIAASGRTPYVIAGLEYARQLGCRTVGISCNPGSAVSTTAEFAITPVVGAEVVTGSSRMKAGTAQKLVLNMLSTGLMIKSGKVFGNLMVDVVATNEKLHVRQVNIVKNATGCSAEQAEAALVACERNCKTAIVMVLKNLDAAILLGGHSHKQEQREYAEKTYLNPGSLGLALDGVGGHAHFAILTLENSTWQIECFQIPYDLEGYLAEFDRAGLETHGSVLARSLKRTLTCGVNYFYLTVKRVRELADALALTDLDEEVWKKAEQELK